MSVIKLSSVADTHRLAAAIASQCDIGDCVLLHGELGAGKTEFARGFIHEIEPSAFEIVSPTFTLVQHYPGLKPLWHFDFYRLKNKEELRETGLEDALASGITLIEWPELAQSWLPHSALKISIDFGAGAEERVITLSGADIWQARLAAIEKAFYNK